MEFLALFADHNKYFFKILFKMPWKKKNPQMKGHFTMEIYLVGIKIYLKMYPLMADDPAM